MAKIKIWHIILAIIFIIAVVLGISRWEPSVSPARYVNPQYQKAVTP